MPFPFVTFSLAICQLNGSQLAKNQKRVFLTYVPAMKFIGMKQLVKKVVNKL